MGISLYVGNISWNTSEDDLRDAFAQAGAVASAKIITDRDTGRSKGFGFVEMEDQDGAQAAIAMWDGVELGGRPLRVNEARPREPRY